MLNADVNAMAVYASGGGAPAVKPDLSYHSKDGVETRKDYSPANHREHVDRKANDAEAIYRKGADFLDAAAAFEQIRPEPKGKAAIPSAAYKVIILTAQQAEHLTRETNVKAARAIGSALASGSPADSGVEPTGTCTKGGDCTYVKDGQTITYKNSDPVPDPAKAGNVKQGDGQAGSGAGEGSTGSTDGQPAGSSQPGGEPPAPPPAPAGA